MDEKEVTLTYAKLKDGTIVESPTFDVGETLDVVSEDGTKTPAPDGEHELALKDSEGNETLIKVITKDGKIAERENVELEGEVEIDIKPGVHSNSQIEIKNKGHIIVEDDASELIGSIIIIISESVSTIFERDTKKNENLIYKHKLTFVEALCGFTLEIPHPSGKTLLVESNELINGLSQYKINNKGLPVFNRGKTYGDIIFKFEIVYPNEITEEQKEKLATLFNYKNKECSKPETEIITGNLILSLDDDTESENDDNVQQGQGVQCAQS